MNLPFNGPFKIRILSLSRADIFLLSQRLEALYGRQSLFGDMCSDYIICTPRSWAFGSGHFSQYKTVHINHIKRIFNLGGQ